jgi:hypothetical protein
VQLSPSALIFEKATKMNLQKSNFRHLPRAGTLRGRCWRQQKRVDAWKRLRLLASVQTRSLSPAGDRGLTETAPGWFDRDYQRRPKAMVVALLKVLLKVQCWKWRTLFDVEVLGGHCPGRTFSVWLDIDCLSEDQLF